MLIVQDTTDEEGSFIIQANGLWVVEGTQVKISLIESVGIVQGHGLSFWRKREALLYVPASNN